MGFELHSPRFAAIDIGSHTIRMIIAQLENEQNLVPLRLERRITRLARNFHEGESLKEAGMRESMVVLEEYAALLEHYRVSSPGCGATGVVRRAANGEEFLQSVGKSTGIQASIFSETTEAYLSAKGVLSVLPEREGLILSFDLGGSSTEFLLMDGRQTDPLWSTSIFIGAATITERYLPGDPPSKTSIAQATDVIRKALAPVFSVIEAFLKKPDTPSFPFQVVATAGTATTLAAMYLEMTTYEPYRVNGLHLTKKWLEETIEHLAGTSVAARRDIAGLESGREDIILGGALIVREVLRGLNETELIVTDGGLLEGILLHRIEEQYGWPHALSTHLTWKLQKG